MRFELTERCLGTCTFRITDFPELGCDPPLLYQEIRCDPKLAGHLASVSLEGLVVKIVFNSPVPPLAAVEKYVQAHQPRLRHTEKFERQYPRQAWALEQMTHFTVSGDHYQRIIAEIKTAVQNGTGCKYGKYLWEMAGVAEEQASG